ncbi:RNA polymerase sigma factor [Pinibacter aurantiacus]|uniref:RNA polymerase sigma-70 factor n=1 Tax=Pinibacter aurantiacus TaxID=2851599 RepID=A0A9E2S967_9BACT|nr:RNA polymerase sigma-70 factor [Pinibacter aurantiacus]MBV4358211.1 RNA polymerase sigma-70 factor [Pinibacter aurantiacus]
MRLNNEKELIIQLKQGDEKAFVALYNAYSEVLYSFLLKLNIAHENIRDVIQQTFIKLWEHRDTLKEDLSLQSYLITIAKNAIYNEVRKQIVSRKYEESVGRQEIAHDEIRANEVNQLLQQILQQLSHKRREVFAMSRIEGYSNQEIAKTLNISKSTVENHINQSTKQLKEILKKMGFS